MAVDQGLRLERRTHSARTLLGITQKAAEDNIVFVNARTVRRVAGLNCIKLSSWSWTHRLLTSVLQNIVS